MVYCYTCKQSLLRSQALRRNVKVASSTVLSYDVVCPNCHTQIGQVLWGKYVAHPPAEEAPVKKAFVPPKKPRSGNDRRQADRRANERRKGERRSAPAMIARLAGITVKPYGGPERRVEERRKDDRRKMQNRKEDRRASS